MDEKEEKGLAQDILEDYENRKLQRLSIERGWQLNMNFINGMQYCDIGPDGDIYTEDKQFYWQSRRVFNHIAPVVDTRIAKLIKMRPQIYARPASDEEGDLYAASLAKGIIDTVKEDCKLDEAVTRATMWSEVCGTAFYKVIWNGDLGMEIGSSEEGKIYEGNVEIIPLSPYEVYPDNLAAESLESVHSLIHAKAMPCGKIHEMYGVWVAGRDIAEFSLAPYSASSELEQTASGGNSTTLHDYEVVVERYTRPTKEFPEGKVEIAAGGKLLYTGVLPYRNAKFGGRDFPFVMQKCVDMPGAFYGASIVERLIPLQRAYNAVRNRKHEFLNRLSMGVVTVEDGSVDMDELEQEGLPPGKILVYRQGSVPPQVMSAGSVPPELAEEEKRLEEEFLLIGETSEISRNSTNPTNVTSATGLKILLEQYNERLSSTEGNIDNALKSIGSHILRLYRQFAGSRRIVRMTGNGKKAKLFYFSASDICADDVVLETDDKTSPANVRTEMMQLIELGLLTGEDGKIPDGNKNRILNALGFSSFEWSKDLSALHEDKAHDENVSLLKKDVEADEYDDHEIHIREHTRFLLSDEFKKYESGEAKERFLKHLREHKEKKEQ